MVDAHEQIRNLLGIYCERMDAGDFAGLAELFADARLADEHGTVFATGSAEVRTMWDTQTMMYDGSPRTRHVTANPVIDVDETAGTASARSAYVVFQGTEDFPLQPIVTGRYRDQFTRTAGVWRFSRRHILVDHVGDVREHLTFNLAPSTDRT